MQITYGAMPEGLLTVFICISALTSFQRNLKFH